MHAKALGCVGLGLVCSLLLLSPPALANAPLLGEVKVHEKQTGVVATSIDGDGFLWSSGDMGLCRFNGFDWWCFRHDCRTELIAAPNGYVSALCEEGTLIQVRAHAVQTFTMPGAKALVGAEGDDVFIATADGTFAWAPPSSPRLLFKASAHQVARHNKIVWLATDQGLIRWDGVARTILNEPTRFVAVSATGGAFAVVTSPAKTSSLYSFTPDGTIASQSYGDPTIATYHILVDEDHQLLWLAQDHGIRAFPLSGGDATHELAMREGMPYPIVTSMMRDAQGLWAGTVQGLAQVRLDPPLFNLGRAEGVNGDFAFSVATTSDGTVWFTQGYGLTSYREGRVYNFDATNGLKHIDLRTVAITPDGDVWAAGLINRLVRLDLKAKRFSPVQLENQPADFGIHVLRTTVDGSLLMGLQDGGVGQKSGHRFDMIYQGTKNTKNLVFDVLQARDRAVWAARSDGTIIRLLGGGVSTFTLPSQAHPLSLHEDASGTIWAASDGAGLIRIKQGRMERITTKQGLWDDHLHAVLEDGDGWLWFSSMHGIFRISRAQAESVLDGWAATVTSISYQTTDGLRNSQATRQFSPPASKDPQGRLWFSMLSGLAGVRPPSLVQAPPPLSVHIDTLTLNGVAQNDTQRPMAVGDGALSVSYRAPTLWNASRLRYRTRLKGWNETWLEQGLRTDAAYSRLRAGSYTFEVAAYNVDRPDLQVQAATSIVLLPPVYLRKWFVLAAALTFVAMGAVGILTRRRRELRLQRALQRDRTRIAHDIHDSIEQDLTGVKMHVDAAGLWLDKNAGQAREHLARAADLVIDGMADMRSAIWGLRAGTVNAADLSSDIQQRLQRITQAGDVQLSFATSGQTAILPAIVATQIFYLCREAVTNVIKHAKATHVEVTLEFDAVVTLIVQDDGIGLPRNRPSREGSPRGLGVGGMRARAELVGGTFDLQPGPAGGTRLTVRIPLHA
ncbi:MAG: histidine kinase [Deltaproteobacteria bacterium]|nr:histidine kinase [Deltaproteobacteria bacterium]